MNDGWIDPPTVKPENPMKELSAALSKAQGQIEGAAKDTANPFFKSKYADLASVWATCREPLSKNGLSIWQHITHSGGSAYLVTTILHASGERLDDDGVPLMLAKQDMQGLGSALTYARRYGLMAAVGIAPEDDDGNAASAGQAEPVKAGKAAKNHGEAQTGGIVKLKAEVQAFLDELRRWQDAETFEGFIQDNADLLDRCKHDLPGWWATKPGSDAKGAEDRIREKRADLERLGA